VRCASGRRVSVLELGRLMPISLRSGGSPVPLTSGVSGKQ
jgi:hypothetical protein